MHPQYSQPRQVQPPHLTQTLLSLIDQQPPSKPSKQSILQQPAILYSIIRQMYNSFKKDNESKILQNKIYPLSLKLDPQLQPHSSLSSLPSSSPSSSSPSLSQILSNPTPNPSQSIPSLLTLSTFLPPSLQYPLLLHISSLIRTLDHFPTILSLYKKLLKSKQCLANKQVYGKIYDQMKGKILAFHGWFREEEMKGIQGVIIGLRGVRDIGVLGFLGDVYAKCWEIEDFRGKDKEMEDEEKEKEKKGMEGFYGWLYGEILEKMIDSKQWKRYHISQSTPKQLQYMYHPIPLLSTMLKIPIPSHLHIISTIQSQILEKFSSSSSALPIPQSNFLSLLSYHSIKFMSNIYTMAIHPYPPSPSSSSSSLALSEQIVPKLREKMQKIIDFIFFALEGQAFCQFSTGKEVKQWIEKENIEKEENKQNEQKNEKSQEQKLKDQIQKHGSQRNVWNYFIGWYHNLCLLVTAMPYSEVSSILAYVAKKLRILALKLFKVPKYVFQIIKRLLYREAGTNIDKENLNKQEKQMKDEQEVQETKYQCKIVKFQLSLARYFVQFLLGMIQPSIENPQKDRPNPKSYLLHPLSKKLLAYALCHNPPFQPLFLNSENLAYIDILLQTLSFPISPFTSPSPFPSSTSSPSQSAPPTIQFFKSLLSNQPNSNYSSLSSSLSPAGGREILTSRGNFQLYLFALLRTKPKRYKDFFSKVDAYRGGEIFQLHDHYLLKFFCSHTPTDILILFFSSIPSYLPSKFCIQIMKCVIQKSHSRSHPAPIPSLSLSISPTLQSKSLYSASLRTLHILLSTCQADQLPIQFKIHLKQIVQKGIIDKDELFRHVPEKMSTDLVKFYDKLGK